MELPFTSGQFLGVFARYNLAIWPVQVIAYFIAIAVLFLATKKTKYSDRILSGTLSFFWLWMGVVYHLGYFSAINKAAFGFGALFIMQGLLFFISGVVRSNLSFQFKPDKFALTGCLLILYAMFMYPIIGYFLGHGYPQSPSFGVAPCPTTIFTFGLLLWTDKKVPTYILLIPLLWSIIGFVAAIVLGIREDLGLLVAGLIGTIMIWLRRGKITRPVIVYSSITTF